MADARDSAFLASLQLADAFLPTGAYTLSQGLESMIQLGWLRDVADLEAALDGYLGEQVAPADGVAVASAHRAAARQDVDEVVAIDRYLTALKLAREPREGSRRIGRNLLLAVGGTSDDHVLEIYADAVTSERAPGNYAVALGVAARAQGLSAREATLVFLYASAVGMLGAALRLMRLDHLAAQAILVRLRPRLTALAESSQSRPWQTMRSFGPQLELAAMAHERARVRLFTS